MIRALGASVLDAFKTLRLWSLDIESQNYAATCEEWAQMPDSAWLGYFDSSDIFAAFDGVMPIVLALE